MSILEFQPPRKKEFDEAKMRKFINNVAPMAAQILIDRYFAGKGITGIKAKEKLTGNFVQYLDDNPQQAADLFGPLDEASEKLAAIGEDRWVKKDKIEIKKE